MDGNTSVVQDVRRFISEEYLFGRDDGLEDDSSFLQEGILDSTGVLQLIAFLEETYGIKVEDEEIVPDNLDSVNNLAAYLSRKLNGADAAGVSRIAAGVGDAV